MFATVRYRLPGMEVIPKPGFSRRAAATAKYHDQQKELSNAFMVLAIEEARRTKQLPPYSGVALSFVAEYGDRRRRDWSNVAKAIEDALVKAGILLDDNSTILPGCDRCRVRTSSRHPGLVVELREDSTKGDY